MLKKREYKDMDKLNQMTSERDTLSKECAENKRVIQDLNAKLENLNLVIKVVTLLFPFGNRSMFQQCRFQIFKTGVKTLVQTSITYRVSQKKAPTFENS